MRFHRRVTRFWKGRFWGQINATRNPIPPLWPNNRQNPSGTLDTFLNSLLTCLRSCSQGQYKELKLQNGKSLVFLWLREISQGLTDQLICPSNHFIRWSSTKEWCGIIWQLKRIPISEENAGRVSVRPYPRVICWILVTKVTIIALTTFGKQFAFWLDWERMFFRFCFVENYEWCAF